MAPIALNGSHEIPFHEEDILEPIAIVGVSLQFPGEATDLESFWDLLIEGRCVSQNFPADRINIHGDDDLDDPKQTTIPVKGGHFLSGDVTAFDAPFFSISALEAASMDPQQRLLLESTYKALENAGVPISQVSGSKTSVYVGCFTDDYKALYKQNLRDGASHAATGITTTLNANRLSWFYNFLGTSVNVDTACSSSLVALDLACENLRSGASNMSVVGGANLMLTPDLFHILSGMNMLSPDSRSWSFDSRGNGYGRGEGIGILVLKRLETAIQDGDTIRAVIRSTASNQNGFVPGITQPSRSAQEKLIDECYAKAGLDRRRTAYVEAHGTGTPVGDPIEADALGAAFRESRLPGDPLQVGSVKSNIGHLEGSSGIAGVIKAIAMLERGVIPEVADLRSVNPRIDEDYLKIQFPRSAIPWPRKGLRRISVNSFGFGGSNAHTILDDAYHFLLEHTLDGAVYSLKTPPSVDSLSWQMKTPTLPFFIKQPQLSQPSSNDKHSSFRVLPISAADEDGINRVVTQYTQHFERLDEKTVNSKRYLDTLAYTLFQRRSQLPWKAFAVLDSAASLKNFGTLMSKPFKSSTSLKLAFVFTGQGAQWPEMGRELLTYWVFRHSLQEAEIYLQSLGCKWQLIDELLKPAARSRVDDPQFSQTLCTAVQIALVDLLGHFKVRPSAIIGHSSGEIAAAYCFGAISRRSAWKIAYMRGVHASSIYKSRTLQGAMMAVGLGPGKALELLEDIPAEDCSLNIACYNSPSSVTISGDEQSIDYLISRLDNAGIFARKLRTGVAYHSPHMHTISEFYSESLGKIEPGERLFSDSVMISTVSGQRVSPEVLQHRSYWVKNMVSPVKFAQGFEHLCAKRMVKKLDGSHRNTLNVDVCLEIGPHSALSGPIRDILASKEKSMTYLSALQRKSSSLSTMLEAMGQLWRLGYSPDLGRVNCEDRKANNLVSLCNLPAYPFDHSRSYLHESRNGRNYRLQKKPRTYLLGDAASDWNPLEARWSNFIRIPELPWIGDHKINGTILFPAAGMLVIAIQAMKQAAAKERAIVGYELRDINLHTALAITPSERGVETQFFIRRNRDMTAREQIWSDFRLCAYIENSWEEISNGQIRIDYGVAISEINPGSAAQNNLQDVQEGFDLLQGRCTSTVNVDELYNNLRECGLDFGPTFRTIKNAHFAENESIAEIGIHRGESTEDENQQKGLVVHPCTLDGIVHMPMVTYTEGGVVKKPTLIPSKIRKLWVSSSGLAWPDAQSITAASKVVTKDNRGMELQVSAMSSDNSKILMELDGVRMTIVDRMSDEMDNSPEKDFLWNLLWRPDIDMMTSQQIMTYCETKKRKYEEPTDFYRRLSFLHFSCLTRAVREISEESISENAAPHLLRYFHWAQNRIQNQRVHHTPYWDPSWECLTYDDAHMESEASWLEKVNGQGKAHVLVARNLMRILRSEMDPLELLFGSSILDDLYAEISSMMRSFELLDKYLGLYSHKNPSADYLEIGAGTGGSTTPILNSLARKRDLSSACSMYNSYTFTDISESFFDSAKTKYQSYPNVVYKRLDIEEPMASQSFTAESYDMVIASNVLHATKDLSATLRNAHDLLRPGGKLVLYEITNPSIGRSGFIMGLLAGWWLSTESFRDQGPCITVKDWNTLLQNSGFSGVDQEFRDYHDNSCHELSVLITTKVNRHEEVSDVLRLNIVSEPALSTKDSFVNSLQSQLLAQTGVESDLVTFHDLQNLQPNTKSVTVFTEELHRPYLRTLNNSELQELQHMLRYSKNVVWLTRTVGDGSSLPDFGMASGLARVLQSELEGQRFMRVGLETSSNPTPTQIQSLLSAIQQMTQYNVETYELEFEEQNGLFNICRVQSDEISQESVHRTLSPKLFRDICWQDAPPLTLVTETPGLLDSLRFVEDDTYFLPMADDEVEIKVHATGLNFKDCLIALGRVPGDTIGYECAGTVSRVGSACRNEFQLGDRVCMSIAGAFKTYARSTSQRVCALPPSVSFVEGAAIFTQFVTAWTCIIDIARLAERETVLIHAGAGGTGQAAIQISQYVGAEVFVTVSSNEKKNLMMGEYGIPEDHIFYSRDTSFAKGIKRITKNRGVDVVLNSLAGESLLASWDCVAPYGRFVEIGKKDILDNSSLPMLKFNKGVTFSAFDGSMWMTDRPRDIERGIKTIMEMFGKGIFHVAKPLNVYNISDIRKAFSVLAEGKSIGKSVVEVVPTAIVPTTLIQKPTYSFTSDATYVIAGGFGGIGRTIARWMVERGARNLIVLSRSGPSTPAAVSLLEELRNSGVNIQTPIGDIGDRTVLHAALETCRQNMPPIRGCIQATMVLQDVLFENMKFDQWKGAVNPKVEGSWNLHELLPKGMDFFILLSSVSGISGQRGQSNYSAGNNFQDSLAHYRVARGEKAISVDLGAMVDDGYVADNKQIKERLLGLGAMLPITRPKFLAVLEYYCDPSLGVLSLDTCQAVFGINTPQYIRSRGLDEPSWLQRPIFAPLQSMPAKSGDNESGGDGDDKTRDFGAEFVQAGSLAEAGSIVSEALVSKLSRSLSSISETEIDLGKPIVSYGVDSLLAVEIRSWFSKLFQANIPTFEILGGTNFVTMGITVSTRSLIKKREWFK